MQATEIKIKLIWANTIFFYSYCDVTITSIAYQ